MMLHVGVVVLLSGVYDRWDARNKGNDSENDGSEKVPLTEQL